MTEYEIMGEAVDAHDGWELKHDSYSYFRVDDSSGRYQDAAIGFDKRTLKWRIWCYSKWHDIDGLRARLLLREGPKAANAWVAARYGADGGPK